ncbi:hypothetical protein MASR1M74_28040 [Lentimicrobium sp.]
MKKTLSILLLATFFIACNSTTTTEKADVNIAAVKTIQLHVTGMTCKGCEKSIETALAKLEGVTATEASHIDEMTTISYDTTLQNVQTLTQAIKDVGYTVETTPQEEPI